jgi:methionine sulfoxide reductase heme-binding subunit
MRGRRALLNGWPIVGWAAVALAAMVALILAIAGTDEPALRLLVRATARSSVVLFSLAFAASALRRVWPTAASRWLLTNRRQLGVSFAVSHLVHLLAILALFGWSFQRMVSETAGLTLVFGGIAYLFIAAMTATSFDRTAAWLGAQRWKRLHTVGAYYIWGIFMLNFGVLAFSSALYWPFALILTTAFVLRLAVPALERRSRSTSSDAVAASGGWR